MKFLIDRCLHPSFCSQAEEMGHSAVFALPQHRDQELNACANQTGRVIITSDFRDFFNFEPEYGLIILPPFIARGHPVTKAVEHFRALLQSMERDGITDLAGKIVISKFEPSQYEAKGFGQNHYKSLGLYPPNYWVTQGPNKMKGKVRELAGQAVWKQVQGWYLPLIERERDKVLNLAATAVRSALANTN